jgi:hypothetical protein
MAPSVEGQVGMITGMTTVKRAVTIDADLDREAQELAAGNFSSFVSEALRRQVRATRLERLVALDAAERGPVDDADVDAVVSELRALDR